MTNFVLWVIKSPVCWLHLVLEVIQVGTVLYIAAEQMDKKNTSLTWDLIAFGYFKIIFSCFLRVLLVI
ncbi:hypothetical protein L6452_09410 [Arctium lappa]|uniref:Uncharacterized protein n=1 Tax=Arctium lappa TaxID=4217 RepID=A0ACB9DKG5_ARCLA|nr:hypothetical protein L6452_09410 [Arctium lappa]